MSDLYFTVVILIVISLTYFYQRQQYLKNRVVFGRYPWSVRIFLAPIYEEIIFRGSVLYFIIKDFDIYLVVVVSCLLFGLWHLKNFQLQSKWTTVYQMFYAGFIIGPVLAIVTVFTGTLFLAMLLHALNNLLSPIINKHFVILLKS